MLQNFKRDGNEPLAAYGSCYTDDDIFRIGEMLRDGMSAGQIAAKMRGKTRNAIIGLVQRNKYLRAIGFERSPGQPRYRSEPKPPKLQSPKFYTVEDQNEIAAMLLDGASSAEIADKLGRSPGAVRNFIFRTPRLKDIGFVQTLHSRRKRKRTVFDPVSVGESLDLPLADLENNQCRYATNNAKGDERHLFCGQETHKGTSWCEAHYRVVHGLPLEGRG